MNNMSIKAGPALSACVLLAACTPALAAISEKAVPLAETLLGRPLASEERIMDDRELWARVALADELLADWIANDEKIGVRETPLSVEDPEGRLNAAFEKAGTPLQGSLQERLKDYRARCARRRAERLANVVADAPRWVMCRHFTLGGSFYAYTEAQSDARGEHFFPGLWSALVLVEATQDGFWKETVLKEAEHGCFRDAEVTPDGRRVVYAFKAQPREDDFHLYEMDVASRETKQLTFGKGFADYEPCCLPGGDIVFNSTRCVQVVDCAFSDVSNLYVCHADGSCIRRLCFDQVHDNFPTLTCDGRIVYTRWDYNDRSQIFTQLLFGMNADGTCQRAVYGDNSWFPTTPMHTRSIPGTGKYAVVLSGHHVHQAGKIAVIDPAAGRQEGAGISSFFEGESIKYEREDAACQSEDISQYPYPLSEKEMVLNYLPEGWPSPKRRDEMQYDRWVILEPFGLYWIRSDGARELLLPRFARRMQPGRAIPLRPAAARPIPPGLVDLKQTTGTFFVQDVMQGEAMKGVNRDDVKTLRIIALEYRPIGVGRNGNNGPGGGALVTTPISIARGAWDVKVPIGDVPVEADGSCWFSAPAGKPLYFQLLDKKGRAIQTMRSWTVLQPGENMSCVGCHETRNEAAPVAGKRPAALERGPYNTKPILDEVRGFSFKKDVQPILDRRCVSCHGPEDKGRPDLTETPVEDSIAQRWWTRSYLSLTGAWFDKREKYYMAFTEKPLLNWINPASEPTVLKPYSYGSARSLLFTQKLDKGHAPGLTDEESARLAMWVDLLVPFCGAYDESGIWSDEERRLYAELLKKRERATQSDMGPRIVEK